MNEGLKFSAPRIKIRVCNTRYIVNDNIVKCIINIAPCDGEDPYTLLSEAVFGARLMKFEPWGQSLEKTTNSATTICLLHGHTYCGIAKLKDGDVTNLDFAKKIAYLKAYRQLISYYLTNYSKMYDRLSTWLDCISCNEKSDWSQAGIIEQLVNIYNEYDEQIKAMIQYE